MNKFSSDLWVKCSDRLPDIEDDSVIVLFPNGSVETVHIEDYFSWIGNGFDKDGSPLQTMWYISQGIEYWHPLPEFNEVKEEDHVGCPAYPNCDINSLGCHYASGENVEWFGHRD